MPSPPDWLQELADTAAQQLVSADILAPVGCHFCQVGDIWEVSLFASRTQIVGGSKDGVLRSSRFQVDLQAVARLFSEVHNLSWQPLPLAADDDLGAHVVIDGIYAGHSVSLRILSRAPRQFAPGRRAIVYRNVWEEIW